MNLQSFGISNFKAFGQSIQRMPLKPITLIFGPNSAGKSSLLHGLLWTTEAIMQDSFDVRTSKRVSGTLDLGGFLSVLRGHDPANKIKIAVGLDNLPSGEPIQITYEIGIRTEEDAHAIFLREWIGPDLEIGEFHRQQEVMRATYPLFDELFNYQNPSTEEVEAALLSEVAWEEQIERQRSYYEELEISSKSSFPPLAEAREQYSAAQKAWSRKRELAPSVVPRVQKFWQQFAAEEIKENQGCSVISCEVHIGEKRVMRADRRLGARG